ncbi:MAG: hypothetical protein M1836_002416 [Candelina mexicana]|nr:MAG: hypothetical protein M1836_002416 [Candelina mexicana]
MSRGDCQAKGMDTAPPIIHHERQPLDAAAVAVRDSPDGKLEKIQAKNASLLARIEAIKAKRAELIAQLQNKDAAAIRSRHIRLLHDYNDIKDVGMGLMGIIADNRGVRVSAVYADFGVAMKD